MRTASSLIGNIAVRRILFLDFDGVLHPDGFALFSRRDIFEAYALKMPEAEIVVSSTWREDHDLEGLKSYFSPPVRDRIIGATPSLEDGYECGGRQREIQAYLESAGLDGTNCSWVALDDMPLFFEDDCPNLVLTDSTRGFTESDGDSLLEWYRNALG
jgi:hypothetical protein